MTTLKSAMESYAEELRHVARIRSPALIRAFATVPRERFLGPGPWRLMSEFDLARSYWTTEDADPRHVYHNVLVALDEARGINNGSPSLWAFVLDHLDVTTGARVLHLGCGTGYYSAILAELAGPIGAVTAVELDGALAARAREALAPWPRVDMVAADGTRFSSGPVDIIVASAGTTRLLPHWLDSLNPGGRLVFPLTSDRYGGGMLKVTRLDPEQFRAAFLCRAWFIGFAGARDAEENRRLEAAIARGGLQGVMSVRRDAHEPDGTCWLHHHECCLSRNEVTAQGQR